MVRSSRRAPVVGTQRVPAILMGSSHTPLGIAILSTASMAGCIACGKGADSAFGEPNQGTLSSG